MAAVVTLAAAESRPRALIAGPPSPIAHRGAIFGDIGHEVFASPEGRRAAPSGRL
eukprot:CAMPEP_0185185524 /NCGR_PEP_ID=MMETSP1140-20130426/3365_1 /TAXON_ID=298111 /ORGANISM="Pavlova sp., Strain CCMP459" /LENGTH=54 /DNA_ID=CAMNT_0027751719 /DNA_START=41 /DNA_END=202 /DNA_ORIENTATION=+